MRPRHRAAEYRRALTTGNRPVVLASMRPRHRAAEYEATRINGPTADPASMRPRHRAAEYIDPEAEEPDPLEPLQ